MKTTSSDNSKSVPEQMLNVPLAPEVKRDLGRVAFYNSRTQRRQAALYIQRAVARDIRRIRDAQVHR